VRPHIFWNDYERYSTTVGRSASQATRLTTHYALSTVLLSDPPPSQADLHFRLLGIPVRVHPLFWVGGLFLGANASHDFLDLVLFVAAFLPAILAHELGHALAAMWYGFRPWITLYGMGGLTSYNPAGNFGRHRLGTSGQILISLAGPIAGFILAAGLAAAIFTVGRGSGLHLNPVMGRIPVLPYLDQPAIHSRAVDYCNDLFAITVFWGLINLLPIYPLDGGQIAQEILLVINRRDGIRQSLILSCVTAIAMAVVAITQWHSGLTAIFFGYLAYSSYMLLQGGGMW
jgi:stage IV sporulation protein FB